MGAFFIIALLSSESKRNGAAILHGNIETFANHFFSLKKIINNKRLFISYNDVFIGRNKLFQFNRWPVKVFVQVNLEFYVGNSSVRLEGIVKERERSGYTVIPHKHRHSSFSV